MKSQSASDADIDRRAAHAREVATDAAAMALEFFRQIHALEIESKGLQDPVSNADREVELYIRKALSNAFPQDGIIGEEHAAVVSSSGFTWVIDPIDGTANFIVGNPGWAVVIACVHDSKTVSGVIHDPIANEHYHARIGRGAWLNDNALQVSASSSLDNGVLGVGHSTRVSADVTLGILTELMQAGGIFYRNGSGALMLAYVAAARLIGYCEPHMNCWDCIAGMLMIEEAGGQVEGYDMSTMLNEGTKVVTACPGIYQPLQALCQRSFEA